MEITMEKQRITLESKASEEVLEQAVDNEIMLPEFCGNMARILKCRAKAKIISKRIVNSVLNIDGNVFLTVFYIDEEGCLKTFDQTLTFYREMNLDRDKEFYPSVKCKIEHMGCRMVSARKIELHGCLSLTVSLFEMQTEECVKSVAENDVQLCSEQKDITVTVGCTEKYTAITDEIELDESTEPITCILRSDGIVEYADCKTMAGKVIVKGELYVTVCYSTDRKNRVDKTDCVIPFTQIVDMAQADEDCFARAKCEITALDVRTKTVFDGDVRTLSVSAGINTEISLCKNVSLMYAADAYSVKNELKAESKCKCFEKCLSEVKENFTHGYNFDFGNEISSILDIFGDAAVTEVRNTESGISVLGTVQICVVACDGDMSTVYFEKNVDFSHEICRDNSSSLKFSPEICIKSFGCELSQSSAKINVNMTLTGCLYESVEVKMLTDITVDEKEQSAAERRPVLMLYYCGEEEKVFEIARRYKTTVEAVKSANGFETDEIPKDSVVLIPVV